MSRYAVVLMPQAQKDLDAFTGKQLDRFEAAILGLQNNPRPHNAKKLAGSEVSWRIRIGDYRILYEVMDASKSVKIYRIAHRKDVYR
jgi:mRNA interferase RelE/StbE